MHVRYRFLFTFFVLFVGKINFNRKSGEVKIYERTRVSFSLKGTGMHRRFYLVLLYAPPFISI